MSLVVFAQLGFWNGEAGADLLADQPALQELVGQLLLILFKRDARVVADEVVEFLGVGDLGHHLHFGQPFGHLAIHADIQILGLLHHQQQVDLIPQEVLGFLLFGLGKFDSLQVPLLAQEHLQFSSLFVQLAAGDDVPIHFGGNFLHHADVCGNRHRQGRHHDYYKPANHSC